MTLSVPTATPVRVRDISILMVEDDPNDERLIRACLAEAGVADSSIAIARTLADGIRTLAEPPGCVLLDLDLPDVDGYNSVARMVASVPHTAVIVLTGRREHDGQTALAAGAQDYLIKDLVTGEVLERSIRYAMERKRAQAAAQLQIREFSLSAAEQSRLERGLLPTPMLRSDAVGCATYYRPGRDDAVLGGDFYDVVETSDGRIRAVVGDVMGHGPDEAALGIHLRVAWRTMLLAGTPDEQILPTLARLLSAEADHASRWATVCDLTIDLRVGRVENVTVRLAGHPAPIVCAAGDAHYPDLSVGLPLGLRIDGMVSVDPWPTNYLSLPDGGSLVMYTDGLLDAFTDEASTTSIGITELTAAVVSRVRAGGPPAAWIPALLADSPREPVDDTAAVVLTVNTRR